MEDGFDVFEVIEGDAASGLVLLCDHARNALPSAYGNLGLPASEFERHIAYDIGVEPLTRALAERLGAPAVLGGFSRLLIDPNRGTDDPTVVMRLSDGTVIPGNHPITDEEIDRRIETYHAPYHKAVATVVEASLESGNPPMIVSVHSFTPAWKGVPRPWEIGILWDADPRLPDFLINALREDASLTVGDNEPYDGALKNDTMHTHATRHGLAHALLEVRNDLIADDAGVAAWADRLAPLLESANALPHMHEIKHHGSRTDVNAEAGEHL